MQVNYCDNVDHLKQLQRKHSQRRSTPVPGGWGDAGAAECWPVDSARSHWRRPRGRRTGPTSARPSRMTPPAAQSHRTPRRAQTCGDPYTSTAPDTWYCRHPVACNNHSVCRFFKNAISLITDWLCKQYLVLLKPWSTWWNQGFFG